MTELQLQNLKYEAIKLINTEVECHQALEQARELQAIYNAIEVAIEAQDDAEAEDILFYLEDKIAELSVQDDVYHREIAVNEIASEKAHESELWSTIF